MAYFRLPLVGYFSHWHVFFTVILALLLYSLNFLPASEFLQGVVAIVLGFVLSFPVFTWFKKTFFRRIIAFDQGGVFSAGQYKFERLKPVPEVIALIKKLKSQYNTALLSNQPPDMYDSLRKKFAFDSLFDYQIIPMHAWAEKPDPKIYHTFLKITGRKASDVIFIDDLEANIIAAKKIGMKGIVFKSLPQLKEALQAQGISV